MQAVINVVAGSHYGLLMLLCMQQVLKPRTTKHPICKCYNGYVSAQTALVQGREKIMFWLEIPECVTTNIAGDVLATCQNRHKHVRLRCQAYE